MKGGRLAQVPGLEGPNKGHPVEPRIHPTADMSHAGIKSVMVWVCSDSINL